MKQPQAIKQGRGARPARPAGPARPERNSGPILRSTGGRRLLTPFRIGIALAFFGSLVFIGIGIVNRNANQIPILVAGLAVLALTLGAVAIACVVAVIRAGRDGRDASAFWAALAGGMATLGAAGAAAAAWVMALVWGSAAK